MSTRDLVNALISGSTLEIEKTFGEEITSRISAALDTYRETVARDMFGTVSESVISEEVDEDKSQ